MRVFLEDTCNTIPKSKQIRHLINNKELESCPLVTDTTGFEVRRPATERVIEYVQLTRSTREPKHHYLRLPRREECGIYSLH